MKHTTIKIDTKEITLTVTTDANTLDAITTATQSPDITTEEFTSAVWSAIKKEVKARHILNYSAKTPDVAVVNAVYSVTYGGETKSIIIPLVDLLAFDAKLEYNNKALMLQTATATFINTDYDTSKPQQRINARKDTEKTYKGIIQWAFDFLTADRKDGVKVYANDKDVDIISGMLLKLRAEKIKTTGERTIQAYIEYAFRQKIAGRPFYVELYSLKKEESGDKISSTPKAKAEPAEATV